MKLHYVGSFQRGELIRNGDPLGSVWRNVERFGTIDNLARIAAQKGYPESVAKKASLRIQQAVELRNASRGTSALSRPLLLYYSALNLIRGVLATHKGDMGSPSHGLQYKGGTSLLECTATASKAGTFVEFTALCGLEADRYKGQPMSLADVLGVVPELTADFGLLRSGRRATAQVVIDAYIRGDMTLRYYPDKVSEEQFSAEWKNMLPWMIEDCEYHSPFTLKLKKNPQNEEEIVAFCEKRLLRDLNLREDAVWHDHVVLPDIVLLPRISAYLAALFILSNASRYEPELIDSVTRQPTDVAYALTTFLNHAERYLPQLILEVLRGGRGLFFE